MKPSAPKGAWRLKIVEVLPSTSELCRTLADAGEPEGLAVLARRQTQGRGSRGRSWESPAGNLSLSVLLRPREVAKDAAQWALLAGVAMADALLPYVTAASGSVDQGTAPTPPPAPPTGGEGWGEGGANLTLKWPNDVLLDGRKLAGILIDSATDEEGGLRYIVIGMGANLSVAPDLPDRPAASLAEFVPPPPPEEFASALLARIGHWRHVRLLEGFAPIRAAWHDRAQEVGTHMTIKHDGQILGGAYAGIGEDGSLLLQAGGRVRAFTTGEVLLGGQG